MARVPGAGWTSLGRSCGCPYSGHYPVCSGGLGEATVTPYPWEIDRPQPITWERVGTVLGVIGGLIGLLATVSALRKKGRRR